MTAWYRRTVFSGFMVVLLASTAGADMTKLDPRARVAFAELEGSADIQSMIRNQAAVSSTGELDVFIVGNVSRAELENAGAIVHTEVNGIFTALIPVDAVEAVAALAGVVRIQG